MCHKVFSHSPIVECLVCFHTYKQGFKDAPRSSVSESVGFLGWFCCQFAHQDSLSNGHMPGKLSLVPQPGCVPRFRKAFQLHSPDRRWRVGVCGARYSHLALDLRLRPWQNLYLTWPHLSATCAVFCVPPALWPSLSRTVRTDLLCLTHCVGGWRLWKLGQVPPWMCMCMWKDTHGQLGKTEACGSKGIICGNREARIPGRENRKPGLPASWLSHSRFIVLMTLINIILFSVLCPVTLWSPLIPIQV